MKMTKLLTGAAIAALMTGAASAQVYVNQGPTTAPNTSGNPFVTGDYTFASELGSLSGNTIPMEFEIEPGSTLAQ